MKDEKKKKKKKFRALRIVGKVLLGLVIFIVLLLLFIRSPWGQSIIVDELIASVEKKTGAQVEVEDVYISFSGNININGLYIEDLSGDTLLYSKSLEAAIPLWPIIKGKGISINSVQWQGLTANIARQDSISGFNYQFLLDAYAPADTVAQPKDTTATNFNLGELHFRNFDVAYHDAVSGTNANLHLGEFNLKMETFNLEEGIFKVADANLANTEIKYVQSKPFPETEDTTSGSPPIVGIDNLKLDNVKAIYKSDPDKTIAKAAIADFLLKMPMANLAEKEVVVNVLRLDKSQILVKMNTSGVKGKEKKEEREEIASEAGQQAFEWPEWHVLVEEISLNDNEITYLVNGQEPQEGNFNPDAIAINNLNLQLNNVYLKDRAAGANLEKLSFSGASGINLKNLSFEAGLNSENFRLNNLALHINENMLQGELEMKYDSINALFEHPENVLVRAQLPELQISVDDAFLFQPELRQNEYLQALTAHNIMGNLQIEGTMANLQIPQLQLNWGANTAITARGNVQNLTDPENIQFDFPQFDAVSARRDLIRFVEEDSLSIAIPEEIRLSSSFRGSPDNITATASVIVPEGKINVAGNFLNREKMAFDANLEVVELNLGQLLQNPQLGQISLVLESSGAGADINSLDAVLDSKITNFSYNGYQFKNLNITGKLENGKGPIALDYKDYNLKMAMKAMVDLDTVSPSFKVNLNVEGADLQALGLSKRAIKTQFTLDALYQGQSEGFNVTSTLEEGIVVYDNESYLLGDLDMAARIRPDSTSVSVTNKMLKLELQSNTSPTAFVDALQQHFKSYISEKVEIPDTIANPVQLQLQAHISQEPILNEVLLPNLKRLDTVNISVDFNQSARKLDAFVSFPHINFNENIVDSLLVELHSDKNNFEGQIAFNAINAGPLKINRTNLTGNIADDRLYMDFKSYTRDSLLVNVQSVLNAENDSLYFHIDPSELLLNGNEWNIPESNRMVLAEDFVVFEDFELDRNNQEVFIISKDPNNPKENISFSFENFKLSSILGFLNPENNMATGELTGALIIEEPFDRTGFLANLKIKKFHVLDMALGKLSLDAQSMGNKQYNFDLALNEGNIDLDLTGNYIADTTAANLDLNLDLNKLELAALQELSNGAITNPEGFISGRLEIHGTTAQPVYNGLFEFNDALFTVSTLNAQFGITNEQIKVDTTGIYFDTFKIQDENSSGFILDGVVHVDDLTNPAFDLSFNAENFKALSSTSEDNELYYGTAVFDVDGHLGGDLNLPIVDLTLTVQPETNLTYTVPVSEIGVISHEGVVVFVNKENPNNILTRGKEEETTTVSGMIVNSRIKIEEGAAFTIILNPETGDNLRVVGEGILNFDISETGNMHLAGVYNLSGGHYEMNLYGLVNRRFEIMPESSVSWFGNPFDAALDITAVYNVETSASALMAAQTTNMSAADQGRFRQELPFLVYLNVDGRLMQPVLSFGLGMPEDEQGAIGGAVYGRIQEINEQENELNKQVFSLLVLNRFYPQSSSYGSQGGTLTMARDNLNEALSDQLNMFSDKLMGDTGVNLNFGLDSYTDYQGESPQERTALEISAEKRFFDDRFIVEVGSEVDIQGSDPNRAGSNPLIGNFSLQYLLTEDGRFRLKAFRKNTFENVIDGEVIINGIALIFQKEFNEFKNLWASAVKKEEEKNKEKEKKE